MVAVAAPAGYGKSQLISAWLMYLQTQKLVPKWVVLAVTGVAASNAGGTTVHAFFRLRKNETSAIFKDREAQDELRHVQGLIIDEAFMADRNTISDVIQICWQIPLKESLRQSGALRLFGYRHVLVFGDLRQLPPASSNPPFWASETFQTYFEIFTLREDRRHERDAEMRTLKELIAWGGCEHTTSLSNDTGWKEQWPVDRRLVDAFCDMTLQGLGLSGENIDLEVGTAVFATHAQKDRWNDGYVSQIEKLYWNDGFSRPGPMPAGLWRNYFETVLGCSLFPTPMTQETYACLFSHIKQIQHVHLSILLHGTVTQGCVGRWWRRRSQ